MGATAAQAAKAETLRTGIDPPKSSLNSWGNRDPERGGAHPRCSGRLLARVWSHPGGPPAAAFPQKASRDLTLLQKMGMEAGKGPPGILTVGQQPWGLPALAVSPSGPLTLVYPHSHQNNKKEKVRIEKEARRTEPLSWEPLRSSFPGPPPAAGAPSPPCPTLGPSPGLELPGFFPASGISRGVTAGTEQARPPEETLSRDPVPDYIRGRPLSRPSLSAPCLATC